MEWALTAIVLGSVSLLVVVLTMGQDNQTVEHRSSLTVSAGRSLLVLRHLLLSGRTVAITTGHRVGRTGRIAWKQVAILAVSVGRGVQARLRDGVFSRSGRLAAPQAARSRSRAKQLRFEDCLQVTGPVPVASGASRSTLSLAPMPMTSSAGWLSRLVAAFELVVVIAVSGGAIALALIAAGWKASHIF